MFLAGFFEKDVLEMPSGNEAVVSGNRYSKYGRAFSSMGKKVIHPETTHMSSPEFRSELAKRVTGRRQGRNAVL